MERAKYRYSLTVNAFSEEEIAAVEKRLKEDKLAAEKLCLDKSFGPSAFDGSFLAIFSSDSLSEDGFVKAWGKRSYGPFFVELIRNIPGIRCTFKRETDDEEGISRHVWGKTRTSTT